MICSDNRAPKRTRSKNLKEVMKKMVTLGRADWLMAGCESLPKHPAILKLERDEATIQNLAPLMVRRAAVFDPEGGWFGANIPKNLMARAKNYFQVVAFCSDGKGGQLEISSGVKPELVKVYCEEKFELEPGQLVDFPSGEGLLLVAFVGDYAKDFRVWLRIVQPGVGDDLTAAVTEWVSRQVKTRGLPDWVNHVDSAFVDNRLHRLVREARCVTSTRRLIYEAGLSRSKGRPPEAVFEPLRVYVSGKTDGGAQELARDDIEKFRRAVTEIKDLAEFTMEGDTANAALALYACQLIGGRTTLADIQEKLAGRVQALAPKQSAGEERTGSLAVARKELSQFLGIETHRVLNNQLVKELIQEKPTDAVGWLEKILLREAERVIPIARKLGNKKYRRLGEKTGKLRSAVVRLVATGFLNDTDLSQWVKTEVEEGRL